MTKNLPVPVTDVAPITSRWLFSTAPPLVLTGTYRLIPPQVRVWSRGRGSTSHLAMSAILAGGGWRAMAHYAMPTLRNGLGGPFWDPIP